MSNGRWIRTFLIAGGLLCGLAPLASAQPSPGLGMYQEDSAHASGQYGLFSLAVRRAIGSGLCGTDGDYCAMQVDANGALHVVFTNATLVVDRTAVASANNTGACVTVDTTSDTILASFSTRRGATILNNGSVTVFMKLGATATTAAFPVAAGGVYNLGGTSVYTGVIDGITASSSTSVCVLEY